MISLLGKTYSYHIPCKVRKIDEFYGIMEDKAQATMDRETALKKSIRYCQYQERSRKEVSDRLLEWGLDPKAIPSVLAQLEEQNVLNESRFAREYAHGKFKNNGWGKIRIKQGLFRKGLSDELISEGLTSIPVEEYRAKLQSLISKKMEIEHLEASPEKNQKVARYVASHGFEPELIWTLIHPSEI